MQSSSVAKHDFVTAVMQRPSGMWMKRYSPGQERSLIQPVVGRGGQFAGANRQHLADQPRSPRSPPPARSPASLCFATQARPISRVLTVDPRRVPQIIPLGYLYMSQTCEILLCSRLGTTLECTAFSVGGLMSTDSTALTVPDDRSPRCWGSLITGSLDLCAPEFAPGVHDANATSRPGPHPAPPQLSLACTASIRATDH